MLEIAILSIYFLVLTLIFLYCFLELGLGYQYLKKRQKKEKLLYLSDDTDNTDIEKYPFVTVQLPVFNEMYVVERLIDQVVKFDYPKDRYEIQVLDDSTDETLEISQKKVAQYKAQGFNIELIHRTDRTGFKAGALQNGMEQCKGEFIAIFDADFLPKPDFLRSTLPYFKNPKIGVVQTRWAHINREYSLLTRIQAFFLDAHFTVEQAGRNNGGYFINFNGTAGVWRKETIISGGGWQSDTLTEDLDLSYRAQLKGWEFKFLEGVVSPAELPSDMLSFKSQQFRWIKGGAETARKTLPEIVKSDLPFLVKLNAFLHLLSSSIYMLVFGLVFFSIPLLFFKNTFIKIEYIYYTLPFFITNFAIAIFFFLSNIDKFKKPKGFLEFIFLMPAFLIITMGMSLHNTLAAIRGLLREKTPFIRTPKFNITKVTDVWKNKNYAAHKIDGVTVLEGVLTFYFLSGIIYACYTSKFDLIILHTMAVLGFGYIFINSVRHSFAR